MLAAMRQTIRSQAVYKFRGYIPAANDEIDDVFRMTVTTILEYCSKDCIGKSNDDAFPVEAWKSGDFQIQDINYTAECQTMPELHIWTLHLKFIKEENINEQTGEYLNWCYDISLMGINNGLEFGLEINIDMDNMATPVFSAKLVAVLGEKVGLSQGRVLNGKHLVIKDIVDVENFYNLLSFSGRQLPVIAISQINRKNWEFTPTPPLYLIDAASIANKLAGLAHVVQLSAEGSYEWSQLAGTSWSVYDGAVRIFKPRFDINNGSPYEHPIYFKDLIWEQHGVNGFYTYLLDYVRRTMVSGFFGWGNMIFLSTARIVKEVLKRTKEPDEKSNDIATNDYEKRIGRLTVNYQREKRKCEKFQLENLEMKEKNQHLEGLVSSYERSIEQMNRKSGNQPGELKPKDIEIPSSFKDMTAWSELYLQGRLYLHPNAVAALEKTKFKTPKLVYKALLALAFEYRDVQLGAGNEKSFKLKCSALGLRKRNTISSKRPPKEAELYYINYPYHTSERRLLDCVLTKGNFRQNASCLRIYFLWDETGKEVVVGYLPSHISNKITRSKERDK